MFSYSWVKARTIHGGKRKLQKPATLENVWLSGCVGEDVWPQWNKNGGRTFKSFLSLGKQTAVQTLESSLEKPQKMTDNIQDSVHLRWNVEKKTKNWQAGYAPRSMYYLTREALISSFLKHSICFIIDWVSDHIKRRSFVCRVVWRCPALFRGRGINFQSWSLSGFWGREEYMWSVYCVALSFTLSCQRSLC